MRSISAALIVLTLAAPVAAQDGVRVATEARTVDVEQLPIDLKRIQRELRQARDIEEREGLNLRYTIHIYGSAPPLQIFNEDANLANGPVPYGAPTHQEIINQITPIEYRAPFADFSALMRWLADRKKK
jgi:hypothetical protein